MTLSRHLFAYSALFMLTAAFTGVFKDHQAQAADRSALEFVVIETLAPVPDVAPSVDAFASFDWEAD